MVFFLKSISTSTTFYHNAALCGLYLGFCLCHLLFYFVVLIFLLSFTHPHLIILTVNPISIFLSLFACLFPSVISCLPCFFSPISGVLVLKSCFLWVVLHLSLCSFKSSHCTVHHVFFWFFCILLIPKSSSSLSILLFGLIFFIHSLVNSWSIFCWKKVDLHVVSAFAVTPSGCEFWTV